MTERLYLRQGDIFLTASETWLGKAIRYFQRSPSEAAASVNHVGLITHDDPALGWGLPADHPCGAHSIEALHKVRFGSFREFYGPKGNDGGSVRVAIYRDTTLTRDEALRIANRAITYKGAVYGYLKLALHAADWWVSRQRGADTFFFRRLARIDRYPICSYLVAQAYSAAGRNFGVEPCTANPDDIWDYVTTSPKYVCVHPLGPLEAGE